MAAFKQTITRTISQALIVCLRAYQYLLSPLLGPRCRFHPTCSHYAIQALNEHGVIQGGALAAKRLCRCHPLNRGGLDPVPPNLHNPPKV